MDEKRTCKNCRQSFPATEDFFYRTNNDKGFLNLRTECKACHNERSYYNQRLAKAKREQIEKDKWKEELKDKIFVCKHCGQEKKFEEMKIQDSKQTVTNMCKKCSNKKIKEIYRPNHHANLFEKAAKERQELNRGEKMK